MTQNNQKLEQKCRQTSDVLQTRTDALPRQRLELANRLSVRAVVPVSGLLQTLTVEGVLVCPRLTVILLLCALSLDAGV